MISVKVFIAEFVSGVSMNLCSTESVGSLKLRICHGLNLDVEHRFLTHRDRILLENQTLEYYGVENGDTVRVELEDNMNFAVSAQVGTTSGFHMQDIVHPLASHNGMSGDNIADGVEAESVVFFTVKGMSFVHNMSFNSSQTVGELMQYLFSRFPFSGEHLTHKGRIMWENQTLGSYGVKNGDIIDLATRTEMEDMNSAAGTLQARTSGLEINQNANSLNSPRETPQRLGLGTTTGTLPASSTSLQLYQTGLNIPLPGKRQTNFPLPGTHRRRPSTRHTNFPQQSSFQTRPMLVGQQITAQNDRVAAGNMGRPEVLPEEIYDVEVSQMTVSQIPRDPQLQSMNTMDQLQVNRQVSPQIGQMGPQEGVNDIFNVAQERYATQLVKLREMGFSNTEENMIALIATKGNLQAAFKRIRDGIPASTGNMDRAVLSSAKERYARQINQLVHAGFDNVQENVQALMATDGNAENAADLL